MLAFLFVMSARSRGRLRMNAVELGLPLVAGSVLASLGAMIEYLHLDAANAPYTRLVDASYYAQVVQLIPVLLIALATEIAFFDRETDPEARRIKNVRTLIVVLVCAVGELSSLLMLVPTRVPANPGDMFRLLESVSFRYSLQGIAMGLAALAWAITARARVRRSAAAREVS